MEVRFIALGILHLMMQFCKVWIVYLEMKQVCSISFFSKWTFGFMNPIKAMFIDYLNLGLSQLTQCVKNQDDTNRKILQEPGAQTILVTDEKTNFPTH